MLKRLLGVILAAGMLAQCLAASAYYSPSGLGAQVLAEDFEQYADGDALTAGGDWAYTLGSGTQAFTAATVVRRSSNVLELRKDDSDTYNYHTYIDRRFDASELENVIEFSYRVYVPSAADGYNLNRPYIYAGLFSANASEQTCMAIVPRGGDAIVKLHTGGGFYPEEIHIPADKWVTVAAFVDTVNGKYWVEIDGDEIVSEENAVAYFNSLSGKPSMLRLFIDRRAAKSLVYFDEFYVGNPLSFEDAFNVGTVTAKNGDDDVTYSVPVSYNGKGTREVLFAAAGYSGGRLAAVKSVIKSVGSDTEDLTAAVQRSESNKYFLIDLQTMRPIKEKSPVSNILPVSLTSDSVKLMWSGAPDAQTYKIYRDGQLVASTEDTEYTDTFLAAKTEYDYAVAAVTGGRETTAEHCGIVTPARNGIEFTADGDEENGLETAARMSASGDGYSEYVTVGGRTARRTKTLSGNAANMRFRYQNENVESGSITYEIKYYDDSTGDINLNYVTSPTVSKTVPIAARTATNTWKTVRVSNRDALPYGNNLGFDLADFAVQAPEGSAVTVASVAADNTAYLGYMTPSVVFNGTTTEEYFMSGSFSDGAYKFSADDEVIKEDYNNISLYLTADRAGSAEISYTAADGSVRLRTAALAAGKNHILLDDVSFKNGVGGYDFAITGDTAVITAAAAKPNGVSAAAAQETLSWKYNGGNPIENGISLSSGYPYEAVTVDGTAGVRGTNEKRRYLLFDIDDARLPETAAEYTVYITYYDTGVTAGGINTKNIQYYDLATGASKAARIFPTLDAKSETETTAAGWKTGYLKLNTNFAGITYTADAAGDIRLGYSKDITQATDNLFTVSEITVIPVSDENAERPVKTRGFYLAGDSIMAGDTASGGVGYGNRLADYMTDGARVVNRAIAGRSAYKFMKEAWSGISGSAKAGDFVFISFGTNDATSNPATAASDLRYRTLEEYKSDIDDMVNKTIALGATPVLISSLHLDPSANRSDDAKIEPYRDAMREYASKNKIIFVDLGKISEDFPTEYYVSDNVHLSEYGANCVASIIASELNKWLLYYEDSDTYTLLTDNCDPYFKERAVLMRYIPGGGTAAVAGERPANEATIFLAGDSICEPLTAAYYPREGWGMEISDYFDDSMSVVNMAKGGKSSRTFLNGYEPTGQIVENDCRMDVIDALACKGDYLFISFGHNDRITETTTATKRATSPAADAPENEESYRYNLKRFVEFARERGMTPVLLTSVHQRSFSGDVLAEDGIEAYRTAMAEVGNELGSAVLDVGAKHTAFISQLGSEGCKKYFSIFDKSDYPGSLASNTDGTHLSYLGAREVCAMICDEIRDNAALSELAALIK